MKQAKRLAQDKGLTLTRLVEDALRERLARPSTTGRTADFTLHTFKGNGLQPGVDLDDSAAVRDLMDGIA